MKKSVLFLFAMTCFMAQAQTIAVNGVQTGVWDADTVLVTGNVTVTDSLRVLPGTLVLFDGFYGITVMKDARFEAHGTASDSIVFTVADTTGFSQYESENGGWDGFQINKVGSFLLDYCVLEYGKAFSGDDWFGGVLNIANSDNVRILHSTLRHSAAHERGGAISAVDSRVQMQACAVNYNTVYNEYNMYIYGGGASFLRCDVELSEMEFRGNEAPTIGGALSLDSCAVWLDRSVFVDNKGINGGGLYLMRSNDWECRLSNLLFDDNYSGHFGGGFALADASPEVYNVLVVNNNSEGVSCNGVFFYGHSSPKMTNCIIYGNYPLDTGSVLDTTQMWVWTMDDYAPEFRNCLIEGGLSQIHSYEFIQVFDDIIDADPRFVDAANHDFRLAPDSPCRDAGWLETPDYITQGVDLDGMPRCMNYRIDMGPYEFLTASVKKEETRRDFARLIGNPLHAQSRIEFDDGVKGDLTVSVYDLTGVCTASKTINVDGLRSLEIGDLADRLAPGLYLVEVKGKDVRCTLKAVK